MTRKVNLSHLSKDECERILAVIQRDCNLRQKEQERLSKIEEELNDKASQRSVLAKRKEFNEKWCILCCSTFNLLFNKKLYCQDCHFYVCRSCAVWESQEKIWLCRLCEHQRLLYIQSCEWFYDHVRKKFKHFGSSKIFIKTLYKKKKESDSENDSGYGPTSETGIASKSLFSLISPRIQNEAKQDEPGDSASMTGSHCSQVEEEEDIAEVRQHVETVVEGLIGTNSLDTARVDCLYDHPQYDKIFEKYHPQLSTASGLLCNALHRAMQNNNLTDGEITPTAAHAALKHIIMEISDEAKKLPILKEANDSSQNNPNSNTALPDNSNHTIYTTYNDLLAAAIINKLIEIQQEQKTKGNSYRLKHKRDDFKAATNESSSDEENENSNSQKDDFSWTDGLNKTQPRIEYIQIEEIEEITQEGTDSEDEPSSRMSVQSSNNSFHDVPLTKTIITSKDEIPDLDSFSELDLTAGQKVPFPELGMDIIEPDDDYEISDESGIDSRLISVSAWEDNWLFRKKRFPLYSSLKMQLMASYSDPPSMVIPNPGDDSQILIGSRYLDQLSELSETNSVGSLIFSSDESSDEETAEEKSHVIDLSRDIKGSELNNLNQLEKFQQQISINSVPNSHLLQPHYKYNNYLKELSDIPFPKYTPQTSRKKNVSDPVFIEVPENQVLHAGKVAHFMCQAKGTKPIGAVWFRGKQQLLPGPQYSMYSIKEKHILEIYDTSLSDSDTYSCVLFNKKGENWKDFSLKIKGSSRADVPPEFVVSLRVLNCIIGENSKLRCTVTGYPEPRLVVFFNSQEIENDDKYKIYNVGYGEWVIEIINLQAYDQGEYTVLAINKLGQSTSSAILNIDGSSVKSNVSELPHVSESVQKKYMERKQTEPKQVETIAKFTEKRTESKEIFESKGTKKTMDPNDDNVNLNDLNAPPRPGTIAEREHKKWLNAIPLTNNPYSAANIAKRLGRRRPSVDLCPSTTRPLTYEEFEYQQQQNKFEDYDESVPTLSSSVDPSRYQRDYYINHVSNNHQKKLNVKHIPAEERYGKEFHDDLDNEEALNSLEEKVYISSGKVFTLEDHVRRLEREVQLVTNMEEITLLEKNAAKVVAGVTENDKQISQIEEEIFRLQNSSNKQFNLESFSVAKSMLSESDGDDAFPSLPSVKNLASKFMPSDQEKIAVSSSSSSSSPQTAKINQIIPEKKVIVIDKTAAKKSGNESKEKIKASYQSSRMIHSLTARNLPKEFRKQAHDAFPKPKERTIFFKSDSNTVSQSPNNSKIPNENVTLLKKNGDATGEASHGYTSDESTASTNSITSSKTKRKTSQSIFQRASYWERRAEQSLLSDSSVCDDFPVMENVPN